MIFIDLPKNRKGAITSHLRLARARDKRLPLKYTKPWQSLLNIMPLGNNTTKDTKMKPDP